MQDQVGCTYSCELCGKAVPADKMLMHTQWHCFMRTDDPEPEPGTEDWERVHGEDLDADTIAFLVDRLMEGDV